jgi:hypothetical protein
VYGLLQVEKRAQRRPHLRVGTERAEAHAARGDRRRGAVAVQAVQVVERRVHAVLARERDVREALEVAKRIGQRVAVRGRRQRSDLDARRPEGARADVDEQRGQLARVLPRACIPAPVVTGAAVGGGSWCDPRPGQRLLPAQVQHGQHGQNTANTTERALPALSGRLFCPWR